MKIGVRLEVFGLPLRRALQEAERLGVAGVTVDAVGDLAPARLSKSGRRDFRRLVQVHELTLAAVNCPLRHGLDTPENLQPRIEYVQQVMQLAYDLGPRVVTVQAGSVAGEENDVRLGYLREALAALGAYGDRIGTTLALETGLESGETLAKFLDRFDSGSLGVDFDPANLLAGGFRPIEDLRALAGKIVHVQAKDVRRHGAARLLQEVPLGHGEIDWMLIASLLDEMDYRGFVTLTKSAGTMSAAEIEAGIGFLRRVIP